MADLNISDELKISKEELLLGKITVRKVGCGAFTEAHGLLANDLSVELGNGTVIPLLDYIGDNNQVLESTLRLVGTADFSLEENRPVGTLVGNLGATGGTAPYVFTVQDARFRIQSNRLETNHVFDFETESSPIQLDLKVTDSTGVYNFKLYTITLTDTADSMSITQEASYTVNEHSANGTNIGAINISGGTSPYTISLSDTSKIYISNTGVITVNGDIEFDDGASIVVQATINDSAGGTITVPVSVNVTEVANSLVISLASGSLVLEEHEAIGYGIATFSTVGGVAPYTYSSTVNTPIAIGNLNSDVGKAEVSADIEYDVTTSVVAPITVTDSTGVTSTQQFTFSITEVAAIPTLVASNGLFNVAENSAAFESIGTLSIAGGTAPYTVTIDGGSTDFSISNTGVIVTQKSFDYETQNSYALDITVTDSGAPMQTDTCHVVIDITDVAEVVATLGATLGQDVSVIKDVYNAEQWFYATQEDIGGGDFKIGVKKIGRSGGSYVPLDTLTLERTVGAQTSDIEVFRLHDIACIKHLALGSMYIQTFNADTLAPSDAFVAAPVGATGFSMATSVGNPSTIFISYIKDDLVHVGIKSVGRDGVVTDVLTDTFTSIANYFPQDTSIIASSAPGKKAIIGINAYDNSSGTNVWNGALYSINDDNTKTIHGAPVSWHNEPAIVDGATHMQLVEENDKYVLAGTTSAADIAIQTIIFDDAYAYVSKTEINGANKGRNVRYTGGLGYVYWNGFGVNTIAAAKGISTFPPAFGDISYPANHNATALNVPNAIIYDVGTTGALLYINNLAELELAQISLPS